MHIYGDTELLPNISNKIEIRDLLYFRIFQHRLGDLSSTGTQEASADWMLPGERRLLDFFGNLKPHQRSTLLGFLESLGS